MLFQDSSGLIQLHHSIACFRCPVGSCVNDKPIVEADLEDDKELKRYIEKKNRQTNKRHKHAPIVLV